MLFRAYETRRRRHAPSLAHAAQQPVAPIGAVDMPRRREHRGPLFDEQRQPPPRRLPMPREIAERVFDVGEPRGRHLLIMKLVDRSEEHTSELQYLMRNSYAVLCLKKKKQ